MSESLGNIAQTGENRDILLGQVLRGLADLQKANDDQHNEIKEILQEQKQILEEHEECLQIFRFSRCKLIPWIGRNRWAMIALFAIVSAWISSLDWLNRWLQWTLFPPIKPGQ